MGDLAPTPGTWSVGPYYKHDVHGPTGKLICSAPIDTPQARVNMAYIATLPDVVAERDRLRDWKESALSVLTDWEKVWEALEVDKIGTLGQSKAAIALREVVRLSEVNAELLVALDSIQSIGTEGRVDLFKCKLEGVVECARAAIAKARGSGEGK